MSFSINFTDQPVPKEWLEPEERSVFAEISIGDFKERLLVPLGYWNQAEYSRQWLAQVQNFLARKTDKAVLVVEMFDPKYANFIKAWTLYRQADEILVTNNIIFLENVKDFSLNTIQEYVPANYTRHNSDGDAISVWQTSETDIRNWLNTLVEASQKG